MAVSNTSPTPERTPVSFRAWLGIVLLFLFFGIFVWVLIAVTPHGDNYEAKRAEAREKKLNDMRNAATQELNLYAWVDKGKGIARIPIDRAMQLTMRDLASKKPTTANLIQTPAPTPATVASPAPPVSPAPTAAGASVTPKPTSVQGATSENRGQPAAASNPPGALPGSQPGPGATPAASSPPVSGQPAVSPSATPEQKPPPGTPPAETPPPEKAPG
jgi:hypothetical protein